MTDTLKRTDHVESEEDLLCTICWDDDEDPQAELAPGIYKTCGGEWRREADGRWRFWTDPEVEQELGVANG